MNIIILDGYTTNPGDMSWEGLLVLGNCTIYDRTPSEEVIARTKDAEIVLTNKTVLSREIIEQLPKLSYIGVMATGYDVVDIEAARERNITVTNIPTYATRAVAQVVFAHLLNLTHHVGHHAWTVRDGKWSQSPDFCYWDYPLVELTGLTMGIIGFGRIGRAVAKRAQAFRMSVCAYDIHQPIDILKEVRFVELEILLRESDVVSLHCQLTEKSRNLINKERLALMKKNAYLINTSRGPLVQEGDLAEALNSGQIAGAGLDVLVKEPPDKNNPLLTARNCYITPHIAWAAEAARRRLLTITIENIKAFLAGKPQNIVNR